tara:strand:- start:4179 stop:4625 length:447 start_codon:yes stop_codon:yes gene_type:complete
MNTTKGSPSNSSDYEIISEPSDTPDVLSYSSNENIISPNSILSPSQISEPNLENIPLTLSPIQNTSSNSSSSSNTSQFKSPLYQSILEGCEEAGLSSQREDTPIPTPPSPKKCIFIRIIDFIKHLLSCNDHMFIEDTFNYQYTHWAHV